MTLRLASNEEKKNQNQPIKKQVKVLILVAQNKLFLCRAASGGLFTLVRNAFLGVLLSTAADVFTKQSYSCAYQIYFHQTWSIRDRNMQQQVRVQQPCLKQFVGKYSVGISLVDLSTLTSGKLCENTLGEKSAKSNLDLQLPELNYRIAQMKQRMSPVYNLFTGKLNVFTARN